MLNVELLTVKKAIIGVPNQMTGVPNLMSGVPDTGGASPHKVEHHELCQIPWLEDPVGRSTVGATVDRMNRRKIVGFSAEWLRWTGLFGRSYARRSDRSYAKVHFLFHAVVEWVSCSGGIQRGSGGGRGWRKADEGGPAWRWVGRHGRGSCVVRR